MSSTTPSATSTNATSQRWYEVENVAEVDSPALLVYPDRVEENIRRMAEMAGGVEKLRPHVKTHKMREVIKLQMAAGITKFKCATIAEAEMVAECGAADVLIAYQLLGPKIDRFVALIKKYPKTKFSAVADDAGAIAALSAALDKAGITAGVLLDVDDGMGRSGIAPGPKALELYRQIDKLPGVTPGGFHVYDGQFRDRELDKRIRHCDEAYETVEDFRRKIESENLPVPAIVAGGTPTFPVHARREAPVQCSPGTCIFWDASYGSKFPDLDFLHAAVLLTRVVSKPSANRLCLDLGYKAVSPDNPNPRVVLLDIPDAQTVVHNEEHLAIDTDLAEQYEVGDPLYGIPFHVCPTVALHQYAVIVRDGKACDRWEVTARNRAITV